MEFIVIYLAKSLLVSFVFWGYYKIFLEGKEFHHYNRFYLLIAALLSIFLPMIRVDWFTIQSNNDKLSLVLRYMNGNGLTVATPETETSWFLYAGFIVLGISIMLVIKVIIGIYRLKVLKSKYPIEVHDTYTMVLTDLPAAPFAFLRNLFWNNAIDIKTKQGEKIFLHELAHIEQKHTIDRLFLQFLKAIFWFNPILYLFNREITLIHEYLADQKAIKDKDSSALAAMLLSQHYYTTTLSGTSPFLSSTIKKRLVMLKKNHNTKFSYARRVLALPLLFAMCFVYMVQAKNKEFNNHTLAHTWLQEQIQTTNDTIKPKKTIKVKSTYTHTKADAEDVEKESFSLRYTEKGGVNSNIEEDVDIFLDGKRITIDEMNALEPGSIKNIDIKQGDKKTIHISSKETISVDAEKGVDIPNETHQEKMVAVATYIEDNQPQSKAKSSYYINGKEVTEEEMKDKQPYVYRDVKNDKDNNIETNLNDKNTEIYLDGKNISKQEMMNINPNKIKNIKIDKSNTIKRIEIFLK